MFLCRQQILLISLILYKIKFQNVPYINNYDYNCIVGNTHNLLKKEVGNQGEKR